MKDKPKRYRPRKMRFAAQVYIANLLKSEGFQKEIFDQFPEGVHRDDRLAFVGEFNRIASRISEVTTLGGVMDAVEAVCQDNEGGEE